VGGEEARESQLAQRIIPDCEAEIMHKLNLVEVTPDQLVDGEEYLVAVDITEYPSKQASLSDDDTIDWEVVVYDEGGGGDFIGHGVDIEKVIAIFHGLAQHDREARGEANA